MIRSVAVLLLSAVSASACGLPMVSPAGPTFGPGWREFIVRVENDRLTPVTVVVAEDESPRGEVVGTTVPATIPPDTALDVTLGIPPDRNWAIFVQGDLDDEGGPLIVAHDVPPAARGRMPLTIHITRQGPQVRMEALVPGWMGN